MYYTKKKLAISIMWIVIGAVLLILSILGVLDNPICSGLGGGWLAIGIMQCFKNVKYNSDKEYKEKVDIAYQDERNRYIRLKAWAWAGYIFVIVSAIISIVLFIAGKTQYCRIICYSMCAILAFYWISYMVLQKKN